MNCFNFYVTTYCADSTIKLIKNIELNGVKFQLKIKNLESGNIKFESPNTLIAVTRLYENTFLNCDNTIATWNNLIIFASKDNFLVEGLNRIDFKIICKNYCSNVLVNEYHYYQLCFLFFIEQIIFNYPDGIYSHDLLTNILNNNLLHISKKHTFLQILNFYFNKNLQTEPSFLITFRRLKRILKNKNTSLSVKFFDLLSQIDPSENDFNYLKLYFSFSRYYLIGYIEQTLSDNTMVIICENLIRVLKKNNNYYYLSINYPFECVTENIFSLYYKSSISNYEYNIINLETTNKNLLNKVILNMNKKDKIFNKNWKIMNIFEKSQEQELPKIPSNQISDFHKKEILSRSKKLNSKLHYIFCVTIIFLICIIIICIFLIFTIQKKFNKFTNT
ncbi:hypothetical protein NUSPORA_01980 [Nucleospora cyclopteri]